LRVVLRRSWGRDDGLRPCAVSGVDASDERSNIMAKLLSQDGLIFVTAVLGILFFIATGQIAKAICNQIGVKRSVRHYQSLTQFVTLSLTNWLLFRGEVWWFGDISQCFAEESLMGIETNRALHIMYGLHLANDCMQLFKNLQALTIVQTSASILLIHDAVTISLVLLSWYCDYAAMGVVVMFVHDFTDVSFHSALVVFETGSEHVATWLVYLGTIQQWVYFRMYTLSRIVSVCYTMWRAYSDDETLITKTHPKLLVANPNAQEEYLGVGCAVLIGFMAVLVMMHTVWLVQIIQKIAFEDDGKSKNKKKD